MTDMEKVEETPPEPPTLAELITGVQALTKSVQEFQRKRARDRLLLVIAMVGLVLDLALSGLFFYQHTVQTCQNHRSTTASDLRDDDFKAITTLISILGSGQIKTPTQFSHALKVYSGIVHTDQKKRDKLGNCG